MQGVVLAVQTNLQYIDANIQVLDAIFTAYCGFIQIDNVTAVSQQSSAGTEELLATMEQYMTSNSKAQQLAAIADTLRIALAKLKKRESCW